MYKTFTGCFVGTLQEFASAPIVNVKGVNTKEILHYHAKIEDGMSRVFLIPGRNDNPFAKMFEAMWVLAGSNDLKPLLQFLPRAADFSDDGKTWRAGYGPRLREWPVYDGVDAPPGWTDQLQNVLDLLQRDPMSRQAVVTIWNPAEDWVQSKDIPCNNWLHFIVRDGKLHLNVAVRSNDAWWGFSGINFFEWSFILQVMAKCLDLGVGSIGWNVTSMHLYERHWDWADRVALNEIPAEFPRLELEPLTYDDFCASVNCIVQYFSHVSDLSVSPLLGTAFLVTDIPAVGLLSVWWHLCYLYVITQQARNNEQISKHLPVIYKMLLQRHPVSDQLVACFAYLMREIPKYQLSCGEDLLEIMNSTHPDVCAYVRNITMSI